MNRFLLILFLSGFLCPKAICAQVVAGSAPAITARGAGHRIWESYTSIGGGKGDPVYRTNTVVELATGLHYWDGKAWAESKEEIEIVGGKAVARKGNHKVTFAGDLATAGAIELEMADGKRVRSHVTALSYYDAKTGQSVLIAEVKSADGFVLPPNQVLYADAFTGIKADVRYTYTKAGLEQDVILREAPPSPAEYGFDPATTRLEVLTEFLQAPVVRKQVRVMKAEGDGQIRRRMAAPDFVDEVLDFGEMKMGAGKAFQLVAGGQAPGETVPVGKQWERLEGRDFLIEAVQYPSIRAHLETLPKPEAKVPVPHKGQAPRITAEKNSGQPALKRVVPRELVASRGNQDSKTIQLADFQPSNKGVVLDYLLLSSSITNMTFAGDTTYFISGEVVLEGTTTFEGGAVIKYTNNVANNRLRIKGPVVWDTAPYRPAVFTAMDDNTVGENITGSTGSPTNYYATTALLFDNGQQNDIKHIRVSHAATAIDGASVSVSHGQFVNSGNGLSLSGNSFSLHNVLFSGVLTNIYSSLAVTGVLEHVTFDRANYLAASATNSLLLMTNSLIYSVTNYGPFSWSTNQVVVVGGSSPFTNVGSGWHYLPTNSAYLNVGTTNISASLRRDFAQMTTQGPEIFTNSVTSNTTLIPKAVRDTNQPDLGYHYYAIDYAAGTCSVSNSTLTLTNGVTLGVFGTTGLWLQSGSRLVSEGSSTVLNRFVRYTGVQEVPSAWGTPTSTAEFVNSYVNGSTPGTVKFRFTEFVAMNGDTFFYTGSFNNTTWQLSDLDLRDCLFFGGTATIDRGGQTNTNFRVINNAFKRVYLKFTYSATNTLSLNNVHDGGTVYIRWSTNAPVIRDSVFTNCVFVQAQSTGLLADHNAYINQTNRLSPIAGSDIVTNLTFIAGPLGRYYQTNSSPLINAGSQSATNVGLYHYTTTTNQVKETNGIVDIGFHYVALDAQGNPLDTDGDGIPDYLEDKNGNGVVDAGETDWLNPDSDYDGISDGAELAAGTDPLNAASVTPTRLGYWRFNSDNWVGEAGELPIFTNLLSRVSAWSGTAVDNHIYNSRLIYRDVEANGKANINLQTGTIRFWYKPSWAGQSMGGPGPGSVARLLSVGSWTGDYSYGLWQILVNGEGNGVYTEMQGGGLTSYPVGSTFDFASNNWNQIVLTYSATNTALYINGDLKASGTGIAYYPSAAVRAQGFSFGNSVGGYESCVGLLDELETFNYQLNATDIYNNYQDVLNGDWDGDGVPNYRDANPNDPYIGGMAITIERPKSGVTYP